MVLHPCTGLKSWFKRAEEEAPHSLGWRSRGALTSSCWDGKGRNLEIWLDDWNDNVSLNFIWPITSSSFIIYYLVFCVTLVKIDSSLKINPVIIWVLIKIAVGMFPMSLSTRRQVWGCWFLSDYFGPGSCEINLVFTWLFSRREMVE